MIKHIGTRTLETERLILRQFKIEDACDMFNNWASDENVTRYLTWLPHKNIDGSREILKMWIDDYDNNENYNWAIVLKENKAVIGSIALMNIDNHNENCEIGYCISRMWWNKGITTEAFSEIIKFAFKEIGFARITGRHVVGNKASGCVLKKCGLKYEGTLRKIHRINNGMIMDCKYYSILKEEYIY